MKEKTKITLVILGVLIGIILLVSLKTKQIQEDNFISFEMYDKNMNLIQQSNSLSIVNGNENVSYLKFKLNLLNTGKRMLTCQPIDITSSEVMSLGYSPLFLIFRPDSMLIQNIYPQRRYTWNSPIIESSLLESENIVTILGRVKCSYTEGAETVNLDYKTGTLQIYVKSDDERASFDVSINVEWKKCWDGVCTTMETFDECPQDCIF